MFVQGTLPTTEGLHETGSGIGSGTDMPQLFCVNESNEVVEWSVFGFKVAILLSKAESSFVLPYYDHKILRYNINW